MKLDSEDLTGLAALLLRRFPTDEARSEVLRAAGVEDPGDWSMALQHAQAAGRLAALLRLAAQAHPDDENLQGIAATLDRPQVPKVAFAVAGVALVVLIGGAIAWYGSADEKINRIADERATDRPAGVVVAVPCWL